MAQLRAILPVRGSFDRLDRHRNVVLDLHAPTASVNDLAVLGDRTDLKKDDRSANMI
ncbi:MAG: hypothetical protein JGK24_30920 [Microcoleus sp. PH2017_29_MFU_D_A]|uniref:hypothetical protein n=1 Tax=unclassified Microcoleus TaxID=2642155 RepID=UPI001E0E5861|nr:MULTISPECIES: hypothetical protein [unclassified Microcoleus]MCC3588769.1 hypothetical protein [Microcoleus sp. PH2017_30_WIL_O_A]MCC3607522.1 hypothetical protein [Microcoleus sp. PH2017_29_MFU_D_A]MCC3638518.1 hypothetical protein [Microcoleus sp. PH2017_37_MFU_D_B]